MPSRLLVVAILLAAALLPGAGTAAHQPTPLRFEVTMAPGLLPVLEDGRLFVILNRRPAPEPRFFVGETGLFGPRVLARDVARFAPGVTGTLDAQSAIWPIPDLGQLAPGEYTVQAVFEWNPDLRLINAPENLYSIPRP